MDNNLLLYPNGGPAIEAIQHILSFTKYKGLKGMKRIHAITQNTTAAAGDRANGFR